MAEVSQAQAKALLDAVRKWYNDRSPARLAVLVEKFDDVARTTEAP